MGILLAFVFVWNVLDALIRIPALSYFVLPTTVAKSAASKYKRAVAAAKA